MSNNFSSGGDYSTLAVGLCNPANEMTFELSLTVTNNDVITVGVANGDVITLPLSLSKSTGLIMTVGNIPGINISYAILNIVIIGNLYCR